MQILKTFENNFRKQNLKYKNVYNVFSQIGFEYNKSKEEKFDIGYNVFTISSDFYYRENFHSDIIKSLLDPTEKHNEKSKYLFNFINLLNKLNKNLQINKFDFYNAIVEREKSNIDILIRDEGSKKAILIENKINNAIDQRRQLPKYYNLLKENYKVEAIVYLTLDCSKTPEKNDWTKEEILQIEPLLILIPSYDRLSTNLYKDWIVPSIIESNNADSLFLLKQYGNLIKFLNINSMDKISLKKFYETLIEDDNLETSISIKNMLNDLPEYLAIRIEDRYKNNCYPFKNLWRHQRVDTVFEAFEFDNLYFKMDIWCNENGYDVYFWNSKNTEYDIKQNLNYISSLSEFEYRQGEKNNVFKKFNFHEEEKLFSFIDNLLEELKQIYK